MCLLIFVLLYLSDVKLEGNSVNFLSNKPSKIYLSTFGFCALILHQYSQCNLVRLPSLFLNFRTRIGVLFFRIRLGIVRISTSAFCPPSAISHPRFVLHPHFLVRVFLSVIRIRVFLPASYPFFAFYVILQQNFAILQLTDWIWQIVRYIII